MKLSFHASFDDTEEMLTFLQRLQSGNAETSLETVLKRIDKMANTEVAGLVSNMQASFAALNEQQARSGAALERLLTMVQDMPGRIQAAVDAAVANGVDESQIAAMRDLATAVEGEVAEARAEADRLEAAAPAPTPGPTDGTNPVPVTDPVTPPGPGPVVEEGGSDTTGGGGPAPTPGA